MKKIVGLMFLLFSISNTFGANTYSFTCNHIDQNSKVGLSIKLVVEDFGPEYPAYIKTTKFYNDFTEIEGRSEEIEKLQVKLDLIGSPQTGWSNYHNEEFNLIIPRLMNRGPVFVGILNWQNYKSAKILCRHQDNEVVPE